MSNPPSPEISTPEISAKPPQFVRDRLYAFPPNRESLGGTAYLLQHPEGNVLIDCPSWPNALEFLAAQTVRWLVLTHRTAHARVLAIQQALDCEVIIQEQEAYLLPDVRTTPFADRLILASGAQNQPDLDVIWTCGYSPGSACLYWAEGSILFTGRHLMPTVQGELAPLRTAKTFHWPRQLRSVVALADRFRPDGPEPLSQICPGASIGFLRGKFTIDRAAEQLANLDLEALRSAPAGKI
jgi:glyoxylase-like metal-dependent hydrolase (beta-lactamase superfamily II)